jgi:hypothetical protein
MRITNGRPVDPHRIACTARQQPRDDVQGRGLRASGALSKTSHVEQCRVLIILRTPRQGQGKNGAGVFFWVTIGSPLEREKCYSHTLS